jgi:hypothetical protein
VESIDTGKFERKMGEFDRSLCVDLAFCIARIVEIWPNLDDLFINMEVTSCSE